MAQVHRLDTGPFTTGVWAIAHVPGLVALAPGEKAAKGSKKAAKASAGEVWVGTATGAILRFQARCRTPLPSLTRHSGGVYCLHFSKVGLGL